MCVGPANELRLEGNWRHRGRAFHEIMDSVTTVVNCLSDSLIIILIFSLKAFWREPSAKPQISGTNTPL